jgi:hypothetical protein
MDNLLLFAGTVGGAFALRTYTVSRLPVWSAGSVSALAILPDDLTILDHRMGSVLEMPEIKAHMERRREKSLSTSCRGNTSCRG